MQIEWLTVPEVGERLGVPVDAVHRLLQDGGLVADRAGDRVLRVPAGLITGGAVVKGLPSVLSLLRDARYSDAEVIRWLHTPDGSLPGTPAQALAADRSREVKRRAQALGF